MSPDFIIGFLFGALFAVVLCISLGRYATRP